LEDFVTRPNNPYVDYVEKVTIRSMVQTSKQGIVGDVHLRQGIRFKDNFNRDDEEFIAITNAKVIGNENTIDFLLLRKDAIVWIAPLEDMSEKKE
jgi:hypothetical protein